MCSLNRFLKNSNSACEGDTVLLKTLSYDEKISILSECSLFLSEFSEKLTICSQHRDMCFDEVKKRKKRKVCGIGSISPLLSQHTTSKVGDRHISAEMHTSVAKTTGVFIPVGTPICRLCRDHIMSKPSSSIPISENVKESEEMIDPYTSDKKDCSSTSRQEKRLHVEVEDDDHYGSSDELNGKRKQYKRKCVEDVVYFSQTSSLGSMVTTLDSQDSDASVMNVSRLESLNVFLSHCNVSPVKTVSNNLESSSERTKRRYIEKAKQSIFAVLDTIAPHEGDVLWESILGEQENDRQQDTLQTLKKIYIHAERWQFKKQVLSIIVQQMSFEETQKLIPGLTSFRYYEAKKHAKTEGPGLPVDVSVEKRDRINNESLDHFIDFLTSSHVIKDLPYGQRTLKLDSGEIIIIPNVIRSLSASSLIEQYLQLCIEDTISPLGKSTLYKILTECAASVRKSVEGLDNYVMEGSHAFQTLEEIFVANSELKTKLFDVKSYLKKDFKIHLTKETCILQHCLGYALSIPGSEFELKCDHSHNKHCQSCIDLDTTLHEVIASAEEMQIEKKDALMFKVEKAVNDIKDLQKHIVRSKNQEQARKEISEVLEENDVMVTADWAMKFLPRRYREGQLDWFAKRGINWHVSVTLIKLEHKLESLTHLHLFHSQTSQDASTTTAILTDVVNDLKSIVTNLNKVHLFSDNAGCYKSSVTLSTLRHDIGEALTTYNFSESQNGKGQCDRKAAHAKFVIKKYINEGRDVTTAMDMKKALEKYGEKTYRVRVVDTVQDLEIEKHKETIKNVSSFYNFSFEEEGLRMWQAYEIGKGKLVPWNSLKPSKNTVQLKIISDWKDLVIIDKGLDEQPKDMNNKKMSLVCPMEDCVREFKNQKSLDHHLLQGNCDYILDREPLSDKCKIIYAQKLANAQCCCPELSAERVVENSCDLLNGSPGWALKGKKKKTVFSTKQKDFMTEKFMIGKRTGNKIDGNSAAEDMRNGCYGFSKDEFLTGQQIASFFSRLAQQDKRMDSLDHQAAKEEDKRSKLKTEILDAISK